jgi:putative pyruvate formate lyase activating enzyme
MSFRASYIDRLEKGELESRVSAAYQRLSPCMVCAWECGCDRKTGSLGVCRTGERPRVSSYGPHFGEEGPLRGRSGSGTIFFSLCNLRCQYCQNYDISQRETGPEIDIEELAAIMLELQAVGCHNINLVSPSHVVPQILAGVLIAAKAGLTIPLVYNTGGYDSVETLKLLDGVVDIYMPDMKYGSAQIGRHYSKIREYPRINQAAVKEMHRQVGDLILDESGVAQRGLLVRHLVLPNNLAGTGKIANFLATEISTNTYINVMDQYHPAFNARQYPKVDRRITNQEYEDALATVKQAGLQRLDQRNRFW